MELLTYLRCSGEECDWEEFNYNPQITFELVRLKPNHPWNFRKLSTHVEFPIPYLLAHPELDIGWDDQLRLTSLTLKELMQVLPNPAVLPLASFLPDLQLRYLLKKKPLPTQVTWRLILKYYVKNSRMTLEDIRRYSRFHRYWKTKYLMYNPNLTVAFIRHTPAYVKGKWDYVILSRNPAFYPRDVLLNPDLPWFLFSLCKNPNFRIADLLEHFTSSPDYPVMKSYYLNDNPNITEEDLEAYPDVNWKYAQLTSLPGISLAFILTHRPLGFDLKRISERDHSLAEVLAFPPYFSLNWSLLISRLRSESYLSLLQMVHQLMKDRRSYLSLPPSDMLAHYFELYI